MAIYVGETLAFVSSKKQKYMSKSPVEAEVIALMDNLELVELLQEFIEFLMMMKQKPPTIYQNCSAVVTLVTKGGETPRTKHLRARMYLGKEAVDERRVKVVHVKAEASHMIQRNISHFEDDSSGRSLIQQREGVAMY